MDIPIKCIHKLVVNSSILYKYLVNDKFHITIGMTTLNSHSKVDTKQIIDCDAEIYPLNINIFELKKFNKNILMNFDLSLTLIHINLEYNNTLLF